jgi:hypothetical protein
MGLTLCALAAGLLVGQTPEIPTVDGNGWTQVQSSTQTRTWTQSGVWTPSTGWTWHDTVETGSAVVGDKKPGGAKTVLSRFSDRLSGLFASRQANAGQANAGPTSGWQSTGWHEEAGPRLPVITSRSSGGRFTTDEPPLFEGATSEPKAVIPSQSSVAIKTAFFAPSPEEKKSDQNGNIRTALLSKIGHADDYSWIIGQIEIANDARVVHYAAPGSHDHFGGQMILHGEVDLTRIKSGDLVAVHGSVIPERMVNLYRVQSISVIDLGRK